MGLTDIEMGLVVAGRLHTLHAQGRAGLAETESLSASDEGHLREHGRGVLLDLPEGGTLWCRGRPCATVSPGRYTVRGGELIQIEEYPLPWRP